MLSFDLFKKLLTRGIISMYTVKIWGDPIQKANHKARIIDTAYSLSLWTSNLLSFSKVQVHWFCH